ncbi:cytochrome c [Flammeovirga yaeyamensis]|uniref:Cytochrome c n=1 Tax=Flammeovirga yaeyamensis TaxID=367791 RepID=A0AAX1N6T9_9BACT|nr:MULTISPECIES: cytochrome c [Flammeovirga]ANQ49272.1 cytochrome c [Flammeovirga sp. MY04]MBB3697866.1 cytochrome c553 [Flammeovirga yaeyamensis]NMF35779.1 cytochrome c [Flammeovirga yaeyamensis]QWG03269.1 cytochrome c [Flammeovirga yaeyamensis]
MSHVFLTHKVVVILFFLIYLIKTILLFISNEKFDKFGKIVKVPEMIISFTFLATGLAMLFIYDSATSSLLYIKFALVAASIPLAVIATKKHNKFLMLGSFLCLFCAYGLAEAHRAKVKRGEITVDDGASTAPKSMRELTEVEKQGQITYDKKCSNCHGPDGNAQRSGAARLSESQLNQEGILKVIREGKGFMPKYSEREISNEDVEALSKYVLTLKN